VIWLFFNSRLFVFGWLSFRTCETKGKRRKRGKFPSDWVITFWLAADGVQGREVGGLKGTDEEAGGGEGSAGGGRREWDGREGGGDLGEGGLWEGSGGRK